MCENYLAVLDEGIKYAVQHNSFNKVNLVKNAKNVCVFGLGTYFREAFVSKRVKEKYGVNILCDNNPEKWGNYYEGLVCVSPEELKNYEDVVVIIMLGNTLQVREQLDEMGICWVTHVDLTLDDDFGLPLEKSWFEEQIPDIKQAYDLLEDAESRKVYVNAICNRIAYPVSQYTWEELNSGGEYFGQELMKMSEQEVYVDCGAYNGDSVQWFVRANERYESIHAFELDEKNFLEMKENLKEIPRISFYNQGVWSENKMIPYGVGEGDNEPQEGISLYKSGGKDSRTAEVVKLDDALATENVTFIKMDIEGAEVDALIGAERLIREQKPKLAICVYHRTSDFWNIPLLLKKYVPEYHIWIRHHSGGDCWGTVLYATILE